MTDKPLFVPLKRVYFNEFWRGEKTTEYRLYGPRWNEKTCFVGRPVTLSSGYGKQRRASTIITSVEIKNRHELDGDVQDALYRCYGAHPTEQIICVNVMPINSETGKQDD